MVSEFASFYKMKFPLERFIKLKFPTILFSIEASISEVLRKNEVNPPNVVPEFVKCK